MNDKQAAEFESTKECNFAISPTGHRALPRQRLHAAGQRGHGVADHPAILPTIDNLNLPQILKDVAMSKRGWSSSSAPPARANPPRWRRWSTTATRTPTGTSSHRGSGRVRAPHKNCIVTQREVGHRHRRLGAGAEEHAAPGADVILMGEIRDRETMEHAVAFAETGHLCMATLHANSANQALDRIINFFPEERRPAADGPVAEPEGDGLAAPGARQEGKGASRRSKSC